ncbi:hypothetical protein [Pseudozobellia sp. WGM2]|uniref:hypothetical protein n=1 Tax=Pseudozobellia sp. WGM2 TaxID=2787625 RepID=UPI001AE09D0C|nr:hypothetical protein [Pseudozobellia sp. WGM2]
MRILLTSLVLFFLTGCAYYPKRNNFKAISIPVYQQKHLNHYFSDTTKDYVYKAKIEAFDKTFGGLFIIKKIDLNHHRVVFSTEMGNTIFDFTFQQDEFKVNRILEEMDKKILITILKQDLQALIIENPFITEAYSFEDKVVVESEILSKKHYFYLQDMQLQKIVRVKNGKPNVTLEFNDIEERQVENLEITHQNIKLKISLSAI